VVWRTGFCLSFSAVFVGFVSDDLPHEFYDKTTLESRDSSNENDDHADPWMGYILCNS
jgi:hypothetical protein